MPDDERQLEFPDNQEHQCCQPFIRIFAIYPIHHPHYFLARTWAKVVYYNGVFLSTMEHNGIFPNRLRSQIFTAYLNVIQ